MLLGRTLALAGCALYIFIEYAPMPKRFAMLAIYVLFGAGFGEYGSQIEGYGDSFCIHG